MRTCRDRDVEPRRSAARCRRVQNTLLFAKCLPSWPPSPETRTAGAKFTDFRLSDFSLNEHKRPVVVPKLRR